MSINSDYNRSNLKKIDWRIVTIILKHLYENSYEKRTNLAMISGLQYSRFMRYLKWLQFVKWVEVIEKDESKMVQLTSTGTEICEKLHTLEK